MLEQIEPATGAHLKNTATGTLSRTEAAEQAGISKRQKDTALAGYRHRYTAGCRRKGGHIRQVLEQIEPATGKTKKGGDSPLSSKRAIRCIGQVLEQITPQRGARTDLGTAPALGRKDQDRRTWRQVKRWLATNHGPNMQTLQELRG